MFTETQPCSPSVSEPHSWRPIRLGVFLPSAPPRHCVCNRRNLDGGRASGATAGLCHGGTCLGLTELHYLSLPGEDVTGDDLPAWTSCVSKACVSHSSISGSCLQGDTSAGSPGTRVSVQSRAGPCTARSSSSQLQRQARRFALLPCAFPHMQRS